MKGKIVKGIAGFYYVHADGSGTYECKAKGLFRRQNIKPLTGDNVEIAVIDEAEKTGNIEENTYLMDTPGFSSLYLPEIEKEDLQQYYQEFASYEPACRFQACSHISEPDCGVKHAVGEGGIHLVRYDNYKQLYEELKGRKKY